MERRSFLKSAVLAGASAVAGSGLGVGAQADAQLKASRAGAVRRPESPQMPYRELGRTGERISLVGLGGSHIGSADTEAAVRLMRAAVDGGITFFDNAWDYNDGRSEENMGKALRDGYRQKVFLMTKTDSQSARGFNAQLEDSLRRLQTETIDLVQFHEVVRPKDPEAIFASGGAAEAARAAQKAGKLRYIGFTGHKDPKFHLHMIETADQHGFQLDSVQMPINVMDAHFRSFQHEVIPVANRKGIGVLAMKTFGAGGIARAGIADGVELLHYSMSLPVATVITGMESMPRLEQALIAARTFQPMPQEQIALLLERSKPLATEGRYERFKTSEGFDGTARNPQWLA